MRLGKEAMRRQLDMALDDALDYLRAQLTPRALDRGHRRGRHRVLREARAAVEGPLMAARKTPAKDPAKAASAPRARARGR